MSGQQHEKTRERAPANLGIKFNPALGAANIKRFYATVRALLKSNERAGSEQRKSDEPELASTAARCGIWSYTRSR